MTQVKHTAIETELGKGLGMCVCVPASRRLWLPYWADRDSELDAMAVKVTRQPESESDSFPATTTSSKSILTAGYCVSWWAKKKGKKQEVEEEKEQQIFGCGCGCGFDIALQLYWFPMNQIARECDWKAV